MSVYIRGETTAIIRQRDAPLVAGNGVESRSVVPPLGVIIDIAEVEGAAAASKKCSV